MSGSRWTTKAGMVFGVASAFLNRAAGTLKAVIFTMMALNEWKDEDYKNFFFPLLGGVVCAEMATHILATWMKNPPTNRYETAANLWETTKGLAAGTIGIAIFDKTSEIPAANLFSWAFTMAMVQLAAETGKKVGQMTKDEFIEATELKNLNENKMKLATLMTSYLEMIFTLGLLTYSPVVGKGLENLQAQQGNMVDKTMASGIALTNAVNVALNLIEKDFPNITGRVYDIYQLCKVYSELNKENYRSLGADENDFKLFSDKFRRQGLEELTLDQIGLNIVPENPNQPGSFTKK